MSSDIDLGVFRPLPGHRTPLQIERQLLASARMFARLSPDNSQKAIYRFLSEICADGKNPHAPGIWRATGRGGRTAETSSRPFHLYMSHYAIHAPLEKGDRFYEKYTGARLDEFHATYASMIEGMDKSLGDVMANVKRLGIERDTIVMFVSDSGQPSQAARNLPLRGHKLAPCEGCYSLPAHGLSRTTERNLKPVAIRADQAAVASEELIGPFGRQHVMTDYYACTDLESLLEEIRACFEEAEKQHKTLSLMISHTEGPYRYALRPHWRTCNGTPTDTASSPVPEGQ